jgi:formate dehydrogenase subunit delta
LRFSRTRAGSAKRSPRMSHENSSKPDKLIYMANQIGKFWTSQGQETAPTAIAEHIRKFWDPRMRAAILRHLDSGGDGLDPLVRAAIERLGASQTGH